MEVARFRYLRRPGDDTTSHSHSLSNLDHLTIPFQLQPFQNRFHHHTSSSVSEQPTMPTNLLSLPPELLLLVATCLPPSKILLLRLVNKHLCAAIEKAFKAICCTEVTVSLTCSGLRSLVRFSRSSLAAHVKVLLLKIDGVYTHLQIKSVRVQILPQRCPCSSSQTP